MTVGSNPLILDMLDELISAEDGLSVTGKADSGVDVISVIVDTTPDIVLLDLVMPRTDGMSVMEKVKSEHTLLKGPAFIILSAVDEEQMTKDAFKVGINYYLMKPFDKEILVNKVRHIEKLPDERPAGKALAALFELGEESHTTREEYMKGRLGTDIIKMFHELGTLAHIKGYQYLRDAVAMSMEDQEMMNSVMKVLYPVIAKRNQTTASRVEHAIHHAVEVAWGKDEIGTTNEVFGYIVSTRKSKPTNPEFIALIPDKMLLKYKRI